MSRKGQGFRAPSGTPFTFDSECDRELYLQSIMFPGPPPPIKVFREGVWLV